MLCVGFVFYIRRKFHIFSSLFRMDNVNPDCILQLLLLISLVYGLALKYSSSIPKQYGSL